MGTMSPEEARRLLGVPTDASGEQIRRAYRRRARTDHPDAGGDPDAFLRLQAARDLLAGSPREMPRRTSSPSTGSHRRPSTEGPIATGWGETARAEWHEGRVDTSVVDWAVAPPDPPHAWSRDDLARVLAGAGGRPPGTARGLSRRPGSFLNRTAAWLSDDLFSRWSVAPSAQRGRAGHDVEVVLHFPPGPGRKVADRTDFPLGWVAERRPSSTVVVRVLHPSRGLRETALRSANALADVLDHMGWPLDDWWHVRAVSEP